MKQTYDFGIEFQRGIIKLALVDPNWIPHNREYLTAGNMDTAELETLLRICTEFYDRYDTSPELTALQELIEEKIDGEMKRVLLDELSEIDDIEISGGTAQYVTDRLRQFARKQKYKNTVLEIVDKLETGNLDDAQKLFDSGAAFGGNNGTSEDIFFFDDDSIDIRANRQRIDSAEKVPTLYKGLDQRLRGGLSRKELGLFMMPPGRGKSMALVNMGSNAMISGYNVLYISAEMSAKKTAYRFDSRITGMTYEKIESNPDKYKDEINKYRSLCKGGLVIKEFPARTATVTDIRAYMKTLVRRHNFVTDLLIVDYVDELKRPKRDLETYAIGEVVADLRAIGMQNNIAVWSATQATRAGFSKVKLDMDDIADSWEKAKISDVIIAGCQTDEEFEKNEMRWIVIKNRDNKKYLKPIFVETRFDISSYKELS